jgi:two-component system response regulator LytT
MTERATSTLSAILIDDEQLAREELAYLLKEFPDVELWLPDRNGLEAVKLIEDLEPDVVFLDVQMPGLDGLGVIQKLREQEYSSASLCSGHRVRSICIRGLPLGGAGLRAEAGGEGSLAVTVERARRVIAEKNKSKLPTAVLRAPPRPASPQRTKLLVKSNNRNFIVDAQDVVYATIDDGLITVVATNIEGESNYRTIEELQSNLDPDIFWRVHRSLSGESIFIASRK